MSDLVNKLLLFLIVILFLISANATAQNQSETHEAPPTSPRTISAYELFEKGECIQGDCEHGQGTMKSIYGPQYSGEWRGGKPHGQGRVVLTNSGIFEGKFKNGKRHGEGVLISPDGTKIAGRFENDIPVGETTVIFHNGVKYIGEMKDGRQHGQGTATYLDGRTYSGKWEKGQPHGKGNENYPDGTTTEGYWINGVYIGKEKPNARRLCEGECKEMFNKGELRKGMDLEGCIKTLCASQQIQLKPNERRENEIETVEPRLKDFTAFDLGYGNSISIPIDWNARGERERIQYLKKSIELSKKTGEKFLVDPSKSSVPFQALKEFEEGVASVMATVGPPELSQAELTTWDGEKIIMLGQLLGERGSKVLAQMNCKEIKYSPASKIQIGDIKAVYFVHSFYSPEGKKRIGEKYFIYTEKNSLIISVEYPERLDLNNDFLNTKDKIINSLEIK